MAVLFNFPVSVKTSGGGGTGGDTSLTSADFTYTGESSLSTDSGGWKIKFLSSGTFTPKKALTIDAFIVGGGGAGGPGGYGGYEGEYCGGGGGGGYTKSIKEVNLIANTGYTIVVGGESTGKGNSSSAFDNTSAGGSPGSVLKITGTTSYSSASIASGGSGGSAGGSTYAASDNMPYSEYSQYTTNMKSAGGSDGSSTMSASSGKAQGQGTTTREFGDTTGDLYAGGGGSSGARGGDGGGGMGGSGSNIDGRAGVANTGGGGGGAPYYTGSKGKGGSGIVIIRNAR